MELKCLILNCSPYGPKNDKDNIGKNSVIQYIPLGVEPKKTDKSYGYYISYNVLYDNSENEIFKYIRDNNLVLTPVSIKINGSLKHCSIDSIEKI